MLKKSPIILIPKKHNTSICKAIVAVSLILISRFFFLKIRLEMKREQSIISIPVFSVSLLHIRKSNTGNKVSILVKRTNGRLQFDGMDHLVE